MDIGQRIHKLRTERDLTQEELAKKVGVGRVAVTSWESGRAEPKAKSLEALAVAFGITPSELLGWPDKPGAVKPREAGHVEVPLYGSIAAGNPREMVPVEEFYGAPAPIVAGCRNPFYLRVNGESMNRVLPDGCYALLDSCDTVDKDYGVYAVAVNGDDATVKRVHLLGNGVELLPDSYDPTFRPQVYDFGDPACPEVRVLGKVVWYTIPAKWSF